MTASLADQTPREIDAAQAALWHRLTDAKRRAANAVSHIHSVIGERSRYVTRTRIAWPTTTEEAIAKAEAALEVMAAHYAVAGDYIHAPGPIASYDLDSAR